MSGILWLYQTQGLFMIYVPDPHVTKNSYDGCSRTVGHKKCGVYITLSFNLGKVRYPPILYFASGFKARN